MAKTNVIVTSTDSGKSVQKSLTDINPAVNNDKLAQFGQMLIGLTTNTYQKTDRIIKVNCDTEAGGVIKPTPTLSMSTTSFSAAALDSSQFTDYGIEIVTNSDGEIALSFSGFNAANTAPTACVFDGRLYLRKCMSGSTSTGVIHVTALPSENFGISNTVDFTITA